MTDLSQLTAIVAPPIDLMASNSRTWEGIDLSPITPRIRQAIANVFRQHVTNAKSDAERATAQALVEKWEAA